MTPDEFDYLIRKTITYLEFHSDDTAKELAGNWQLVLQQMRSLRGRKGTKKKH